MPSPETTTRKPVLAFLPFMVMCVILAGTIYVVAQQAQRMAANDPQIQIAEDLAAKLAAGANPTTLAGPEKTNLATSLAPAVIVFDGARNPLASSAELGGATPQPPAGVFDYARQHGSERLTWQPRRGVRLATVIVHFTGRSSGFVLATRSLREVEQRIAQTGLLVLLGLSAALLAAFLVTLATRANP